jgi:hypothetical protein
MKDPDPGACLSSSLQTMLTDKRVKIFSFTSGSFSGFKQVARIIPMVGRCRTIAEPGKQTLLIFHWEERTLWSDVLLIYGTGFFFTLTNKTERVLMM